MGAPHPQEHDGSDDVVQRCIGVVGSNGEHEVGGHELVDGLLPGEVQRLFELQQAGAPRECGPLASGNDEAADVIQEIEGRQEHQFAPTAVSVTGAQPPRRMC
jgi:hypothetical protein